VNLRVGGIPIGDDVDEDTVINVPGVGTLTLFETNTNASFDEIRGQVIMIHLEVNTANTLGLPVGTEVRVAFARTQVETP